MTLRAAAYARQSVKQDEGIERQIARNNALIEARGWTLVETLLDNDVSASKPRGAGTAWHRLIEAATAKEIDVVVAVNLDRLVRSTRDLGTLIDTGVAVTTLEGELDLTSASGELQASILASMARFETRRKAERQRRANEHRRTRGLPPDGKRAFGYTPVKPGASAISSTRTGADGREYPDYGHEPVAEEAAAIRRGYALLLSGSTLASIARRWNHDDLRTTSDDPWTAGTVRSVLSSPRPAGLIGQPRPEGTSSVGHNLDHDLDAYTAGTWEPIIDLDTWTAARTVLTAPGRRTGPGGPPQTLLSGIARCGICGATLRGGKTANILGYRCSKAPHLSRKREPLDEFIEYAIIARMSQPDAAEVLHRPDAPDLHRTRDELRAAQEAETNLLDLVAKGLTTMQRATAALRDVRDRIATLEGSLRDAGKARAAVGLVEATDAAGRDWEARWAAAAAYWEGMTVDERRAVIGVLMTVTVHAPKKGSRAPQDLAGRLAHTEASTTIEWLA